MDTREETNRGFSAAPFAALVSVEVDRYIMVSRFQEVVELKVRT